MRLESCHWEVHEGSCCWDWTINRMKNILTSIEWIIIQFYYIFFLFPFLSISSLLTFPRTRLSNFLFSIFLVIFILRSTISLLLIIFIVISNWTILVSVYLLFHRNGTLWTFCFGSAQGRMLIDGLWKWKIIKKGGVKWKVDKINKRMHVIFLAMLCKIHSFFYILV